MFLVVVTTAAGFAAIALSAGWPLLLGFLGALIYYFWQQHRSPLVLITDREQVVAKRSSWVMLLASLFPILFS